MRTVAVADDDGTDACADAAPYARADGHADAVADCGHAPERERELGARHDGGYPLGELRPLDRFDVVSVHLYAGGVSQALIADSVINDGSLVWSIPTTLAPGGGFAIRVIDRGDSVDAFSETFALVASSSTPAPTHVPASRPTPEPGGAPLPTPGSGAAPRPTPTPVLDEERAENGAFGVVFVASVGVGIGVIVGAAVIWRALRRAPSPYAEIVQVVQEVELVTPSVTKAGARGPEVELAVAVPPDGGARADGDGLGP